MSLIDDHTREPKKSHPVLGVVLLVLIPIVFVLMGNTPIGIGLIVGLIIAAIGAFTGNLKA